MPRWLSGWLRTETVPPETAKTWPLMFQAKSLARKQTMGATSSGSGCDGGTAVAAVAVVADGAAAGACPAPLLGVIPARARSCRAESGTLWVMRVAAPGEMALQVTP